jgi:Protein of unknown function (DUF3352)
VSEVRSLRPVVLAALVVTLAAGCGTAAGNGAGSGDSLAPASALAFASIDTNAESEQWAAAADLLRKLPSGDELVDEFLKGLDLGDEDFDRDVKPALGPEVDLVVLDQDTVIGLTQPADPAALEKLVARGDDPGVTKKLDDGWWAFAENQAALDRYEQARKGGSLDSDDRYRSATRDLPTDALLRLYVNATTPKGADTTGVPGADALVGCLGDGGAVGLAVSAEADGLHLSGSAKAIGDDGGSGVWDVADKIPGGAAAFVSVHGLSAPLKSLLECAQEANGDFGTYLGGIQLALGVDLERDVLPLFENETSVVVYPPGVLPGTHPKPGEYDLALIVNHNTNDDEKVLALVDGIVDKAAGFGVQVTVRKHPVPGSVDLADVREVVVDGEPKLYYASSTGMLIFASSLTVADDLAGPPEPPLSATPAFKRAVEAAGINLDASNGLVYLDIPTLARLAGETGEYAEDLQKLGPLVLATERQGDRVAIQGLLQIG